MSVIDYIQIIQTNNPLCTHIYGFLLERSIKYNIQINSLLWNVVYIVIEKHIDG